jgi:pSer/pThr/pTyr-binding forkhead associated (FHA) protein
MLKCPVCHFSNEDGALFCEQCKSDLSSVPVAAPVEIPMAVAEPVDEPIADVILSPFPMEAIPLEAIPEAKPLEAAPVAEFVPEPISAATIPVADMAAETIPAPTPAAPAPAPTAAPVAATPTPSLAGAQPKLKVIRGLKIGVEFPIYPEYNYIGRADEKPVDVDLEDQEPPDRVWCSRQHSVIHFDETAGILTIEDLNSSNGTYVNRNKVYPGQKKQLMPNDVVQIGTVHLKVLV